MKSRRNQIIALVALLLLAGYSIYVSLAPEERIGAVSNASLQFSPVDVYNPGLRLDVLQRFLSLEYKGVHRNIFSATPPPPPPPPKSQEALRNAAVAVPSAPPPLTIDAKYFGFVSDSNGGHRKAFFASNNNEDIFIAGEGDTILGHFRVVRLSETTADLEEISSSRHVTLMLEQPPNS